MPANPTLDLNDIVEATYVAKNSNENAQIINRQYFRVAQTGTPAVGTLAQFRQAYKAHWESTYGQLMPTLYQGMEVRAKRCSILDTTGPSPSIVYDASTTEVSAFTGLVGGDVLPGFCSVSVWLRTGFGGRNWRGGIRLGPVSENDKDVSPNTNKLTAAAFTAWETASTAFTTQFTFGTSGAQLVVLSLAWWNLVVGSNNPPVGATADVIAFTLNPYIRSQLTRRAPHVP